MGRRRSLSFPRPKSHHQQSGKKPMNPFISFEKGHDQFWQENKNDSCDKKVLAQLISSYKVKAPLLIGARKKVWPLHILCRKTFWPYAAVDHQKSLGPIKNYLSRLPINIDHPKETRKRKTLTLDRYKVVYYALSRCSIVLYSKFGLFAQVPSPE